jgi:glycerol-3-phosphate O-acyltransferase
MAGPVFVPFWLLVLLALLAAWSVLDRLLVPSVRWVLRRRANRLLEKVNTRLNIRIQPFKLTKREVLIDRLLFDPQVLATAEAFAKEREMPRDVAMKKVETYAREIVPAFNAYVYFRVGYAIARGVARLLYRVRLGSSDEAALATLPENATVVFLMNHRSNMDYILVSYLAAERTALSYAVGEWARIWPLQTLFRAMGAYFIRRDSKDALYRKVLERYVFMATSAGVTQAVYPEGGLSRDGTLRPPRLGILDYMLRSFDPAGERDIVFIPVGINYDRVLEDRTLLRDLQPGNERGSLASTARTTATFVGKNLVLMARQKWHRFGYACVNFGTPISVKEYMRRTGVDFRVLEKDVRFARVEELATHLMAGIARVIPVLPVSLVSAALVEDPSRAWSEMELKAAVQRRIDLLQASGAPVYVPRHDQDYAIAFGLKTLVLRRLVTEEGGLFRARGADLVVLRYYANSIAHFGSTTPTT